MPKQTKSEELQEQPLTRTARMMRGIQWHKEVQSYWKKTWETTQVERKVVKWDERPGRVDIWFEEGGSIIVLELKYSDWDRMKSEVHARRNIRRYVNQVWSYLFGSSLDPDLLTDYAGVVVNLVFPKKPRSRTRLRIVEEECEKKGVQLGWMDD